jgi:hypothetical protein
MDHQTTALAPLVGSAIVDVDALPLPVFNGAQMAEALAGYRGVQQALDASMPDQIIVLDGRAFRKKGYWRALAVAFNLTVETVEQRREVAGHFADGRENFGYLVTCRASARGGRSMEGDGACFAVEKAGKFRCPHPDPQQPGNRSRTEHWPAERCPNFDPDYQWRALPAQATEHNIRSHAHTRAFNRAVSNLVGFGEVSAEEVDRDESGGGRDEPPPPRAASTTHRPAPSGGGGGVISPAQQKRMYAIAKNGGWSDVEIKARLAKHGFEHSADVTRDKYEQICAEFEAGDGGGAS